MRDRGTPTRALAKRYPQSNVAELMRSLISLCTAAAEAATSSDMQTAFSLVWYFVYELCYTRRDSVATVHGLGDPAGIVGLSLKSLQDLLKIVTCEPESMSVRSATPCCGVSIVFVNNPRVAFIQVCASWNETVFVMMIRLVTSGNCGPVQIAHPYAGRIRFWLILP